MTSYNILPGGRPPPSCPSTIACSCYSSRCSGDVNPL